jgi:hypothetical protein
MFTYDIMHVHPDKTEELIDTVRNKEDITMITEQPKWLGTWINESCKVLRWSRGELKIVTNEHPMRVKSFSTTHLGSMPLYQLHIAFGEELKTICLNSHTIVGYDVKMAPLWQTNSFTKLADIIDKEVAYQCMEYYEKYLKEFNAKGVM